MTEPLDCLPTHVTAIEVFWDVAILTFSLMVWPLQTVYNYTYPKAPALLYPIALMNPSWRQATLASVISNKSEQTVPHAHWLSMKTSRRPAVSLLVRPVCEISLTAGSAETIITHYHATMKHCTGTHDMQLVSMHAI